MPRARRLITDPVRPRHVAPVPEGRSAQYFPDPEREYDLDPDAPEDQDELEKLRVHIDAIKPVWRNDLKAEWFEQLDAEFQEADAPVSTPPRRPAGEGWVIQLVCHHYNPYPNTKTPEGREQMDWRSTIRSGPISARTSSSPKRCSRSSTPRRCVSSESITSPWPGWPKTRNGRAKREARQQSRQQHGPSARSRSSPRSAESGGRAAACMGGA